MTLKTFLYAVLLIAALTPLSSFSGFSGGNLDNSYVLASTFTCNCTYETVLINGVWWVIVYDSDGKIIDQYPIY